MTRQEGVAVLWPDCTDVRAAANLRSLLCRLPGRQQGGVVSSSPGGLALTPELSIDIDGISGHLNRGRAVNEEVPIPMLRQDVLPGWPEHWMIPTREWFRQVRLRALETLSDQHRAAGRLDSAPDAARAAVGLCQVQRRSCGGPVSAGIVVSTECLRLGFPLACCHALPLDSPERAVACEILVKRYYPLVRACVRQYQGSPEPIEDLIQVGYVGPLKAINNDDPACGNGLRAYAVPCITGEDKRHFRDSDGRSTFVVRPRSCCSRCVPQLSR